jgi:hypothetical protein
MTSDPTNPQLPEQIDKISDDVVRTWYASKRVVGYSLSRITPAAMETWSATTVQILETWPVDQPYLAMYDLSSRRVALPYLLETNYQIFSIGIIATANEKLWKMISQRPNFTVRVAVVFNAASSGNLGHIFAKTQQVSRNPKIQFNSFMDTESALAWLLGSASPKTE